MEQVMLDMIPTGAKAVCHVSQYDIGRTIRFNLISGGAAYTLSGTETVKVYIKKPDGTTAERNIANTSSTYVDWVTGEGDCDQAGKCECELVITSGTTVIGSKNFTVNIEEDPYNEQGVVTETAGPAIIATFTTNVVDLLQEVKCSINPIQNGTPWIDSNEVNKEPYIKRAVAGTATRIGNHLYDKLVGGTVAFNQMVNPSYLPSSSTVNGVTFTNNNDGSITVNGTASGDASILFFNNSQVRLANSTHKYIVFGCAVGGSPTTYYCGVTTDSNPKNFSLYDDGNGNVFNYPYGYNYYLVVKSGVTVNNLKFMPQIIDLTAMFGSTIADYIYGLEQATAGAGVAWFKALFPNDYYAYNARELMSVKATAHVMKNASNQVIGNYALDSNLELRGIPKLVNNKLEYDGDTYESSGLVTRKKCVKRFYGNETGWLKENNKNHTFSIPATALSSGEIPKNNRWYQETTFIYGSWTDLASSQIDVADGVYIRNTASLIVTVLSCSTLQELQTYLASNPLILGYDITPTTEQASPFTNPQVCDENGTEEYTDNRAVAIPVGHETYQANICEITGFDELNIHQASANLIDLSDLATTDITYSSGDLSGKAVAFDTAYVNGYDGGPNFKANTQYTISMKIYTDGNASTSGNGLRFGFIYTDGTKSYQAVANAVTTATVFNCVSTLGKTVKAIYFTYGSAGQNIWHISELILAEGTTATYSPYSGKLIKLEFDDTVYLAEVSCLNGVWKLKLLGAEVDLDTLISSNITKIDAYAGLFFIKSSVIKTNWGMLINSDTVCICDEYAYSGTISGGNGDAYNKGNNTMTLRYEEGDERLYIRDDRCSTVAELLTAIASTKLVYPLAIPIEITLDETEQFEALIGANNVWHDGNGNTEVKYLYNA